MIVEDLKDYVFDEVILYKEDSENENEFIKFINIYKGYLASAETSVLKLKIRSIGANENGFVEIEVE